MANNTSKPRRENAGGYGNKILYRMCEEQPKHKSINIISSKLWIIGRAYAAAIERGAGKKFRKGLKPGEDFCQKKAAPAIKKEKIDKWIDAVSDIPRLTKENLEKSLECHKKVTDLFKKITGKKKRSLASKYLHFHAPYAFFIYDSRAKKRVGQEIEKLFSKKNLRFDYPKNYDPGYASFCARCIFYRDILEKKLRKKITPRMLDMKLLGYKF
jgi:hypothetical protein